MTQQMFGLWGQHSQQWLTTGGLVIAHHDQAELEFLFPSSYSATQPLVCPLPAGVRDEECIPLRFVPGLEHIRFPLVRSDFRGQR